MKKRHAAIVACALIITVGVLALILSAVRTWQFPEPAGKYIPGLIALSVTDTTRSDPFARENQRTRPRIGIFSEASDR